MDQRRTVLVPNWFYHFKFRDGSIPSLIPSQPCVKRHVLVEYKNLKLRFTFLLLCSTKFQCPFFSLLDKVSRCPHLRAVPPPLPSTTPSSSNVVTVSSIAPSPLNSFVHHSLCRPYLAP
ncbi:uncharacterized protein G2W53_037352 [Senna tora]|uniref:Uncharacterized protein n=1 Tax=Senna tora TaxID=362788 RepID=A0A834SV72_9FABA|nr:uncharacterized protein G2W53_037352 [Senna tora]